jgi:hypothetical protein
MTKQDIQQVYLDGWGDATECICNAIHKSAQNPQLKTSHIGREMSALLLEVAKVIEQNSKLMMESLSCKTSTESENPNNSLN